MFPNQPPGTIAATDTSQSITQATAAQGSAASAPTTIAQATVSVANTANLPQTVRTRPTVERQSNTETTRFHPYADGVAREQALVGLQSSDAVQACLAGGAIITQQTGGGELNAPSGSSRASVLIVQKGRDFYTQGLLRAFFDALFESVGLVWDCTYTRATGNATARFGDVGKGAISASSLSFSNQAIDKCQCPSLKELLLRINEESSDLSWRTFLLIKALRS
ncbi:MAG: hypothetical protein ACRC9T_06525, partial [Vibrionaceae bacterium]